MYKIFRNLMMNPRRIAKYYYYKLSDKQLLKFNPIASAQSCIFLFLSAFAVVDYNREIDKDELEGFIKTNSKYLGESLEHIHRSAFCNTMTYDKIRANKDTSEELFYLFIILEKKKRELFQDDVFKGKSSESIEKIVASEFQIFGQEMTRRALIRNGHFIKWLTAIIEDEFIEICIMPFAKFFPARHFKIINSYQNQSR